MTDLPRSLSASVEIAATPEDVYDLVSDVTRTGEWSPVCVGCSWDDPADAGREGAWFTGRNETSERTWETRSQVVEADRPRRFAWEVGDGLVRWHYATEATADGTRLTEGWEFLPAGIATFETRYGDDAEAQIADRTHAAVEGIPRTLTRLRAILEGAR